MKMHILHKVIDKIFLNIDYVLLSLFLNFEY